MPPGPIPEMRTHESSQTQFGGEAGDPIPNKMIVIVIPDLSAGREGTHFPSSFERSMTALVKVGDAPTVVSTIPPGWLSAQWCASEGVGGFFNPSSPILHTLSSCQLLAY